MFTIVEQLTVESLGILELSKSEKGTPHSLAQPDGEDIVLSESGSDEFHGLGAQGEC